MSDLPLPRAARLRPPSWLDGRLLLGVVLVLVSIVVGVKVLASADHYDKVWAVSHDVAAGTVLTDDQLTVTSVRFHDHASDYLAVDGGSPVGMVATQPLLAGEMVPRAAVVNVRDIDPYRLVTVPVDRLHMPREVRGGMAVDVYTTSTAHGVTGTPQLVLSSAVVDQTFTGGSGFSSGGSVGVVLRVPADRVNDVVSATRSGTIDLVQVPAVQAGDPAVPLPERSTPTSTPSATPSTKATAKAPAGATS